jgi:octanoyl-[GcvH]:protein N-octanoyltransferase
VAYRHWHSVDLYRQSFPTEPALDMALSHALLLRVARGELPPAVRVFYPGPTVAFGRLDALRPGYRSACALAREHGFEPLLRLAGGHAAAYDERSVVYEDFSHSGSVIGGIERRFGSVAQRIGDGLLALGADVRYGELEGEYCPGGHSLNAGGRVKVAGIAQRIVRGGGLVSAIVVAGGGERIRAVLVDVYAALDLPWDPQTAGALDDLHQGLDAAHVATALVAATALRRSLIETVPDADTLVLATELEPGHRTT